MKLNYLFEKCLRVHLAIVALLCLSIILPASLLQASQMVDKVVAIVNEEAITLFELDEQMAPHQRTIKQSANQAETFQEIRKESLRKIIDDTLLNQEIEKSEISVTDDDLARAIQGVLIQNQIDIDTLKAELRSKGTSFEEYKNTLKKEIRKIKFMQQTIGSNVNITDAELDSFLKIKYPTSYNTEASYIIWSHPINRNQSQGDIQKKLGMAQKLAEKVRNNEPFQENSFKSERVGPISLQKIEISISQEIQKMEVGSIGAPVATAASVYFIKLLTLNKAQGTKEISRDAAFESLYNQKMTQELERYLMKLKQNAYIDIR